MKKGKEYLFEIGLSESLQKDLDRVKNSDINDSLYDCYLDELYGSINSAMVENEISKEHAAYLRKKYLGLE